MLQAFVEFECDAVRAEGLVGHDAQCCPRCHEQSRDVPFIVVKGKMRYVCCAVATIYDTSTKHDDGFTLQDIL